MKKEIGGITMNKRGLMFAVLVLVFFAVSSTDFQGQNGKLSSLNINSGLKPGNVNVKIDKDYGKMPLYFIPNQGQIDKQVYYYVQGKDKTIYFTSEGITFSLSGQPETSKSNLGDKSMQEFPNAQRLRDFEKSSQRWVVKLEFVGARKNVKPESLEQSGTKVSYFKGKPQQWHAGIQAASKIIYRELWRGIDLVYCGTVDKMKYEFIVHPGADPSQIKLAYRGAESVKENSQGQLEVQTPAGGFLDDTPVAWQDINGKRENVALKYAIENEKSGKETPVLTYGFAVGKYDSKQILILDPAVLVYCGFIGGSSGDYGNGIAVDMFGCAYVTGYTNSYQTTFPVKSGPDLTHNADTYDAFVAKVNSSGTGLVYCGYIGGSADERGNGIAVDSLACAYVIGWTESDETTFPVDVGPDLTFNGNYEAFVAKVNVAGTGLIYCGYIGGSGSDGGYGIAIDSSGCAYIAGDTNSDETTFPVAVGPDINFNGGDDAFVAKVNATGTGLDYCGYIGGFFGDFGNGIAVDTSGFAYVTGGTVSDEMTFPVIGGPDLTFNDNYNINNSYGDAFVAKVNATGSGLVYCGYIGGLYGDGGRGIIVDALGFAYLTGGTDSDETTFPVTIGPDLTYNGNDSYNFGDAFVAKVKNDGTGLDYCGYIGGSSSEYGNGIAVDTSGCAYVIGCTGSDETTFPVAGGPDITYNGSWDVYVAKVNVEGTGLDYCGYIGGSANDWGNGIAVDAYNCAYVTGNTFSIDQTTFPVILGPDLTINGNDDVFVAKISTDCHSVNFTAGVGGTLSGTLSQVILNGGNCTAVEAIANAGYHFVNWTGTGGFLTTTDNPLTVTNVTADMTITANFVLVPPDDWNLLGGLQNNMIVYGKAYNGNNPAVEGDWIGAFGPGGISDCRAITAVQSNGNYYMTIGSDETSGETITFKLWPLPVGPSIDSSESITFIENGVYTGLPLHFSPRGQNFALVNGWNWISFNTLPTDTSFNAVFGNLPGAIEQIKSQTQAAIYTNGTWIGDLTDMSGIANGIMYKVKTNQACAFDVNGMTVPYNTSLSLVSGWNWTAYLPTLSQPVGAAVNSIITPVSQVKSQYNSVVKIGSSLYGDLTEMEPNKGYTILMNSPGTLVYPQGISAFTDLSADKAAAAKSTAVSWPLIKGNQYNMIAYGKVYFEGKPVNKSGYYLAGIGPNGEKDGRFLSPVKTDGSYFATILGNANGEKIKFKLINSSNGRMFDAIGSVKFQADSLKTAFDLKALSIKITSPNGGETWNPRKSYDITWRSGGINNVKIELYKGTILKTVICASTPAGTGKYTWTIPTDLPQGSKYKIKISSVDVGLNLSDAGNDYFTIAGNSGTEVTVL
jgi:uncharacterized repeat protein (TIGR02543 family)